MSENHGHYAVKHKDIQLKDYFETIKKKFWIIAIITVLSTAAGYFYTHQNTTLLYQTSTRIIVGPDSGNMQTLMVMIRDPIIMEKVKNELKLTRSAESIAGQVDVNRIDDSQVIMISVIDQDPALAAAIANTTAASFKSEVGNILDFDDVRLLSQAKENSYPINESQNRTVVIAFVFGLVAGVGFVFLLDSLDGSVRKEREIEEMLGVPVLGVVSNMNKKKYAAKKVSLKKINPRGDAVEIK